MIEARSLLCTIDSSHSNAAYNLSSNIFSILEEITAPYSNIVVLCIGTDRSTGDCLGPLVGHKLSSGYLLRDTYIYGTLNEPVHAKNLEENLKLINETVCNPFIIAIDASLGRTENIGKINLYKGPLYPGAGVSKDLSPVGDVSITGIVNMSGFMEYVVLQNTRLSIVMQMADIISLSIYLALKRISRSQKLLSSSI